MQLSDGIVQEERAVNPRFRLCVPVEYRWVEARGALDGFQGEGILRDISISGARIESASVPVASGTRLAMRFSFFVGSFGTELPAEAVRQTGSGGFGVRFVDLQAKHRSILLLAFRDAPLERSG